MHDILEKITQDDYDTIAVTVQSRGPWKGPNCRWVWTLPIDFGSGVVDIMVRNSEKFIYDTHLRLNFTRAGIGW